MAEPSEETPTWERLVPISRERLVALLHARRLTQKEVATRAKMRPQTLNYLVKGRNDRVRQDERRRLARALRCSVAWLEGDRGAAAPGISEVEQEVLRARGEDLNSTADTHPPAAAELEARDLMEKIMQLFPVNGASPETTAEARLDLVQRLTMVLDVSLWRAPFEQDVAHWIYDPLGDAQEFAVVLGRAFEIVLRPYVGGQRLPHVGAFFVYRFLWTAFAWLRIAAQRAPTEEDGDSTDSPNDRLATLSLLASERLFRHLNDAASERA